MDTHDDVDCHINKSLTMSDYDDKIHSLIKFELKII